jgi:hypothetical protein
MTHHRRRARTAEPSPATRHPWRDPGPGRASHRDPHPRDPHPRDDPEPLPLTADFDRRLAERLAPGCFRVLAAPPA